MSAISFIAVMMIGVIGANIIKEFFPQISETFILIGVGLILSFLPEFQTASVGVTIAAKQIAKGKIQLPIILFVSTATKSTVTTAKVIDRNNIPLKFFRTFFNEVLLPS